MFSIDVDARCEATSHGYVYPLLNDSCFFGRVTSVQYFVWIPIGEVQLVHVARGVFNEENSSVYLDKLQPVSRCGGIIYSTSNTGFPLPRKPYAPP